MIMQQRLLWAISIGLIALLSGQSLGFTPSRASGRCLARATFSPCTFTAESRNSNCPWHHPITSTTYPPTTSKTSSLTSTRETTALFLLLQNQEDNERGDSAFLTLSSPLDRPVLALIDFLSLLVFAAIGKASHAADGSIDVFGVLVTALPFVVSWFVTTPLTGVYGKLSNNMETESLMKETFFQAAKGWIVAIPMGCVLRGVIKGYAPPIPFVIVTMISTLVILGGARIIYSVVENFLVELGNN